MPDLTIHVAYACGSNVEWGPIGVGSSDGSKIYDVSWGRLFGNPPKVMGHLYGWRCTCSGYRYRGVCSHIKNVQANDPRCQWNADLAPGARPATDTNNEPCCPKCGREVHVYRVGA